MKLLSSIALCLFCLLDIAMAQHWVMRPSCKEGPEKAGWESEIRQAMDDATKWALNAHYVLTTSFNDPDVQKIVQHILGNDQTKINFAKEILYNVSRYNKAESTNDQVQTENDVVIVCDGSDYYKEGAFYISRVLETIVEDVVEDQIRSCYGLAVESPPAALTLPAYGVNYVQYYPMLQAWVASGGQGTPPNKEPFLTSLSKPNVIHLCRDMLYDIDEPADDSDNEDGKPTYATMDNGAIQEVMSPQFIARLDPNEKPIDALGFSLAGTLLHELSHTDLAGRTVDIGTRSDCYGWVCIGNLKHPNNADSIAFLGVSLQLWMDGYRVDENGSLHKR